MLMLTSFTENLQALRAAAAADRLEDAALLCTKDASKLCNRARRKCPVTQSILLLNSKEEYKDTYMSLSSEL